RIEAHIGEQDFMARLGGDEFVVLLGAPCDYERASSIGAELVSVISQPLQTLQNLPPDTTVSVGAALGIAIYPEAGTEISSLLKQADKDMYANKQRRQEQG